MTQKEMVLKTVAELPENCSMDDRGEGIPREEIKRQLASRLTS